MSTGRDSFSKSTIDALGKRAGYLCSNPACRRPTIGANESEDKITLIGEAAHITAAAALGARYDPQLTADQRSHISNGIWLCSNCATLIDKDPKRFTVSILNHWKGEIEEESRQKLSGSNFQPGKTNAIHKSNPILEVDFVGEGRMRANAGYSSKNPTEMHDGQLVMVPGNKPIIHWALSWRYKIVVYNNSNYPAFNVKIENVGDLHIELEQFERINNIPPLQSKELNVRYEDRIESEHTEADALIEPRYPKKFNNRLKLKLTYFDDSRNEHISSVWFENGEIINHKDSP